MVKIERWSAEHFLSNVVVLWVSLMVIILFIGLKSQANAKKKEKYYQDIHCSNIRGIAEYKLEDRTRIDCLTNTKAIEHDFAHKWAECSGQAIYYAQRMNLKPVCALIGTEKQFKRYIPRIETINKNLIQKIEIIKIYK